MKKLLVVGASGDVGYGVVAAALEANWQVAAAGRSLEKLNKLKQSLPDAKLVVGDVGSEQGAEQLWSDALSQLGAIDAVVVSVNAPITEQRLFDRSVDSVREFLNTDVVSHFIAAKTFFPKLNRDGIYIGIGGGMADFLVPNCGHMSMSQAALRMMYRAIEKEVKGEGATLKELMILSMVNGNSRREIAEESWLTDSDIGRHVRAIIEQPECFPKPILTLQKRSQVGLAE